MHTLARQGENSIVTIAFHKKLVIFAMPVAVLTAAFFALPYLASLPPYMLENTVYVPYLIFIAGIFLSLHFNRSRAFFVLLMLIPTFWSLSSFPSQQLFNILSLLIPVNITLFCLIREKGILTLSGRLRFCFIALQAALIASVIRSCPAIVQPVTARELLINRQLSPHELPLLTLPLMVVGLSLIAWKTYVRQNPVDGGFFGALAAFAIACSGLAAGNVPTIFIAAGGLILTLGVLQDSYNMAFRDDLTGLPSRRSLNEEMAGLRRRYAIAMLDVDHFKNVNDTHGHDVGDQVLKMVAGKIRLVGSGGKPYRYGGEEFAIVFPRKTIDEVIPCLEDLRKTIADYQLWLRDKNRPSESRQGRKLRAGGGGEQYISITLSIGIAEKNSELRTPDEVIKAADQALYRAKNKGRNRLCS
jgi:diguanylate cyclase (GGDEF)-like protein